MSQDTLAASHSLSPLAKNLRERQVEIDDKGKKALAIIGDILNAITEQGRDIFLAKTHLGKMMSWSEWLRNHVPNLPISTASKYERITEEGITDPRQAMFAFMPDMPKANVQPRTKPEAWEVGWGFAHRLATLSKTKPITNWPSQQRQYLADELQPLAEVLWPDRFTQ